ncbi:MAG: FAD-dependent oxidoreductase [Candidatus Puniceispirillum sp.]
MAGISKPTAARPVVIIGAGIQGCATAFFLSRRGLPVIVLEKDHVGRHASGVNAGGVRRLGRDIVEVPLSLAAMDWWTQIDDLLHIKNGFHRHSYVKLALDDKGVTIATDRLAAMHAAGFTHEVWIGQDQLQARIPAAVKTAQGGILVAGDGWAIPWQITRAFHDRAVALGADFRIPVAVQGLRRIADHWQVDTDSGMIEADYLVNCAGAWGARVAAMAGDDLPLEAHAPMLVVTDRQPHFLDAVIGIMGATLSFKQLDNGAMVIGGGVRGRAEPATNGTILPPAGLAEFTATAMRVFPHLGDIAVLRAWGGIEGYTPDHLPIIGRGSQPGITHGFGFSAHGFQLGPAVGEALADLTMARQPRVNLDAFAPERFTPAP